MDLKLDVVTTERLPPTCVTSVERGGVPFSHSRPRTVSDRHYHEALGVSGAAGLRHDLPITCPRYPALHVPGAEPNTHREVMLSKAEAMREVI